MKIRRASLYAVVGVILSLVIPATIEARVTCIRLTSSHIADTTDLRRLGRFHEWKDKTGDELALAIWKYLTDYETGLYHFNEILEGPDPFDEYATVRDPLKILNTYNMAYCGIFGPVTDGIFQGVGFERGRSFGLEAWNHCATEVWYEDGWHYLDVDVRGTLVRPDGVVASLAEAQKKRSLWVDPPAGLAPFFPKDPDKAGIFDIYKDSRVHYYYRWFQMGHTMDFYLRIGESFTRFWTPQSGRWHHLPRYSTTKWIRNLIEQEPRGPKPNHRDFSRWNHGNGQFDYRPILTEGYTDFEDGYYDVRNLRPGEEGLEIVDTGEAEVTFEIFTPYVIVPRVNDLDDPDDDREASVLILECSRPIKVMISLDRGLSWRAVAGIRPDLPTTVDLTASVKGTYGYLLKLKTSGKAGSTAVNSLNIKTWVQVAPAGIPAMKKGKTTFQYALGDRYGRRTVPMLVSPNTADPEDLKKYVTQMPGDYDPGRHTCRIRGEMVVRLKAPSDTKISWLTVGGTFRTHQGDQAARTDNRIAYAVDRPEGFKEIHKSRVPTWVNHWRYNWDQDVTMPEPADTIYVKYMANTGLNTVRACLHLLPNRVPGNDLTVTHTYRVGSRLKSIEKRLKGPTTYTVECDDHPENVSIKLESPHGRR